MAEPKNEARDGFTLVELLIVVSIMAFVVAVIAATFTLIVRANPSNVERSDDTRALTNLTRWLPDDVASTFATPYDLAEARPSGFAFGSLPLGSQPRCATEDAPDRVSLLNLSWTEGSTTFFVDYFWVRTGGQVGGLEQGQIQRLSCFGPLTSAAPLGNTEVLNMSDLLSELPGDQVPVQVTPQYPPFLNEGTWSDVPAPGTWQPAGTTDVVGGVTFTVSIWDESDGQERDILELSSVTKNVQGPELETGGGDGGGGSAPTNEPPVAGDLTVPMNPGSTFTTAVPVYDYDGTDEQLTLEVTDPPVPTAPAGWLVEFVFDDGTGEHQVELTVPAGTVLGDYAVGFSVTDRAGEGLSDSGLITVTVTDAAPPGPPVVDLPDPPDPPCNVAFDSLDPVLPNPVELAKAKNNPTNEINTLADDVDVTITRSGACGALVLRFDPLDDGGIEIENFDDTTEVRIRKNAYDWRIGDRELELVETVDGTPVVRDSTVLTVVRAP